MEKNEYTFKCQNAATKTTIFDRTSDGYRSPTMQRTTDMDLLTAGKQLWVVLQWFRDTEPHK